MESLEQIILIPAFKPDEKIVILIKRLFSEGFRRVIVVDDGSGERYADIFMRLREMGCIVEQHEKNLGKGAAIKTAFAAAVKKFGRENRYITADADGQHLPEDIRKVAEAMKQNPDTLVLGVRDFGSGNVPIRSLLGNRITSVFFRLVCGRKCPDTQTGLRGIPQGLTDLALSADGTRYEYEMNFLMDAVLKVPFVYVPIKTVYEDDNKESHFRPVSDSLLVYGRFLRFAASSLTGFLVDYSLFRILLEKVFVSTLSTYIFLATAMARICSGIVNFLLNRRWSFHSRQPAGGELIRYLLLFIGQMAASGGLVSALSHTFIPVPAAKIIVDTILFFVSFRIQKDWVFRSRISH